MPKGTNEKIGIYLRTLYTVSNVDVTTLALRYLNVTAAATPEMTKRMQALITASVNS